MNIDEEIEKNYNNINTEALSHQMAELMMLIVRENDKGFKGKDFNHVMKNFSREEMAYVVCTHAVFTIKEALDVNPGLSNKIDTLKKLDNLETNINEL
jgi:hypothetical protein